MMNVRFPNDCAPKNGRPSAGARPRPDGGVALVTTVIVVAMLAVVGVALMQSVTADRASSRSVANYTQAQLAAQAGAAAAQAMVVDSVARYPDSATVWQNIGGGGAAGTNNEATVLYVRAQSANTNLGASPAAFGPAVTILAQPLLSRVGTDPASPNTTPVAMSSIGSLMSYSASDKTMVNLNATNASRPTPVVGVRSSTNPGAPVTAAQWIYLSKFGGATNATNPYVARYAFWVEDESFKVNVNVATNGQRGTSSLGLSSEEVRIDGSWKSSKNPELNNANFAEVINDRKSLGGSFPTAATAAIPAAVKNTSAASELRFLTTARSAGLNISRGGFKRYNINAVTDGIGSSTDVANIRRNLDRVIGAITNTNAAPLFGQRFYRLADVNATNTVPNLGTASPANHSLIYLNKIAANILDYVDSDSQPTIINNDTSFSIQTGPPQFPIAPLGGGRDGPNSIVAMGVENVPRLQEYALHAKIIKMDPIGFAGTNTSPPNEAQFEFTLDHYFEFWNSGLKDAVVGRDNDTNTADLGDVFLKVLNQPSMGQNVAPAIPRGRDFELQVPAGKRFPAGRVTVLTTAPEGEFNKNFVGANIISLNTPDANRRYSGTTRDVTSYTGVKNGTIDRFFNVALGPDVTVSSGAIRNDYETEMLLRNELGYLESFAALPVAKTTSTIGSRNSLDLAVTNNSLLGGSDLNFVRGGSLRGNGSTNSSPSSAEGDPRALNEQIDILVYKAGGGNDQTRFYNTMNDGDLGDSTVGGPQAVGFVQPARWPDFSTMTSGSANAPLVVADNRMESIGELGHVTDPARVAAATGIQYSRGGGRTLRIGQPELAAWYDGKQTNASRTWASWRLADIFTTNTEVILPGLINPNGVLRDNGAALRAALYELTFLPSPNGAPTTANKTLNEAGVTSIVTNAISRMTNSSTGIPANAVNPFWERGEISELSVFNASAGVGGVNMSNTFDRGREEIVRRSIEMITPRGSIFSIYAIGQALQVQGATTNVLSTARSKTTFEVIPQFAPTATNDAFFPDSGGISARFAPPTNYSTRILSAEYD
jgi:hypothetical protein